MLRRLLAASSSLRFLRTLPVRFCGCALPPGYLALAMLGPALAAGWLGLMQVHRRFSLDGLAGLLLILGWFAGLIRPLFRGETEPEWGIALAVLALVGLLRAVAYARWREADWPRTQSSMSS